MVCCGLLGLEVDEAREGCCRGRTLRPKGCCECMARARMQCPSASACIHGGWCAKVPMPGLLLLHCCCFPPCLLLVQQVQQWLLKSRGASTWPYNYCECLHWFLFLLPAALLLRVAPPCKHCCRQTRSLVVLLATVAAWDHLSSRFLGDAVTVPPLPEHLPPPWCLCRCTTAVAAKPAHGPCAAVSCPCDAP